VGGDSALYRPDDILGVHIAFPSRRCRGQPDARTQEWHGEVAVLPSSFSFSFSFLFPFFPTGLAAVSIENRSVRAVLLLNITKYGMC